jgi:hypothetical protein
VLIKRLARTAALLGCLLVIGSSVPAGAAGGAITAGQIDGSGNYAFGQGYDPSTGIDFSVQIQTGLNTFRLHRPEQPLFTISANVLSANFDGPFPNLGFGCWLVPSSDFVVAPDLGARLTFDSSNPGVTECPGDPVGTPQTGAPTTVGPSGALQGITGPVQLNMTWVTSGPVITTRSTTKEACPPFTSIGTGTQQNANSTPSGSASAAFDGSGPFTAQFSGGYGSVTVFSGRTTINGPSTGRCGNFGS